MFLNRNRPDLVHEMVLAYDKATRKKVFEALRPVSEGGLR